jgi:hypothetical protein
MVLRKFALAKFVVLHCRLLYFELIYNDRPINYDFMNVEGTGFSTVTTCIDICKIWPAGHVIQ